MVTEHLLAEEDIIASITGPNWNWYVTSYRVIRRKPGEHDEQETVLDLSFRDITSIRYGADVEIDDPDNSDSIISVVIGIIALVATPAVPEDLQTIAAVAGIGMIVLAAILWDGSSDKDVKPALKLRGRGYLQDKQWSLGRHEDVDEDEVREFAKAVRAQILTFN